MHHPNNEFDTALRLKSLHFRHFKEPLFYALFVFNKQITTQH